MASGARLTPAEDSELLQDFFTRECDGAVINLKRWRQLTCSLSREFIDEQYLASVHRSDLAMGHSTAMSRRHYAQDYETPEFATSDVFYEQTWVDSQFHSFLGLGTDQPPIPLRLRRSIATKEVEKMQESVATAIEHMKTAAQVVVAETGEALKMAIEESCEQIRVSALEDIRVAVDEVMQKTRHSLLEEVLEGVRKIVQAEALPMGVVASAQSPGHPYHTANPHWVTHPHQIHATSSSPPVVPDPEPFTWEQQPENAPIGHTNDPFSRSTPQLDRSSPLPCSVPSSDHTRQTTSPVTPLLHIAQALPSSIQPLTPTPEQMLQPMPDPGISTRPASDLVMDALEVLYGEGTAPKSQAQRDLCINVLAWKQNVIGILPTGSGKSTAWLVPAVVEENWITAIIVPFKELLDQHLANAKDHGLEAIKWLAATKSDFPSNVKLLFLPCESARGGAFEE